MDKKATGSDHMNRISKNVLFLSFLIDDDGMEKRLLKKYYEQVHSGRGTPKDSEEHFLNFLKSEGVISQGAVRTDEYMEDIPDAKRIDAIMWEYYRCKEEELMKEVSV